MGLEASCRHVGMIHSADRLWWFFTLSVLVLVLPLAYSFLIYPVQLVDLSFNMLERWQTPALSQVTFFLIRRSSTEFTIQFYTFLYNCLIFDLDLDLVLTLKIFSKYGMNLIQSFQLSRCEFKSTSVPRPFLFCPLSLHVHVISLSTIHIVLIKLPVSVYSTLLDQVKVWLLILQNDETSAPLWARIPFMRSWASNWLFSRLFFIFRI